MHITKGIMKLRIGKISYANVWPIFYMLEKEADCSSYEFIEGVPSALNNMLREGSIDASWSSSIEYLKNPGLYTFIENHAIDSDGPVGSVLLFSKKPIEELDGKEILMTSQSDTSIALLQIICRKFYGLSCTYAQTAEPFVQAIGPHPAYLLIGDDALLQASLRTDLHIYDLGQLWKEHTGLPFTYALWLVRKQSWTNKGDLIRNFTQDLDRAREHALADLRRIAEDSPLRDMLSVEGLVSYWRGISYNFGEAHKKGFDLFRRYAEELGLLPAKPSS
ncbi:MAG: menaquinone biosynthesis protein [Nitrospirae bacterium]|nr:menaquinone biosynthesis protein [Nitrospirota bacterium]